MAGPTYIKLRADTQRYSFRYVVPSDIRPLLGGRREVTKALGTEDKRLALRLARRLAATLERYTFELELMAKRKDDAAKAYLTVKLLERALDGTLRIEGLEMDPDPAKAEEERKHWEALLGTAKQAAPPSDGRTLGQLVAAYLDDGKRAKLWKERTAKELEADHLRLLLDVMGEATPLSSLSRKDFSAYKTVLCRLPANRRKSALYRDKSIKELSEMDIPEGQRLSVISINNKLDWASACMDWGMRHGYVALNYAEGLRLPKAKRVREHREPYTDEELLRMEEAVVSGAHGADQHPWRKFIPLLLAYQGARREEMAQLRVEDVAEKEAIPTLTITSAAGSVKTDAGARTIPLHPHLIELGFLEYVEKMRKRGKERVFPELPKRRNGAGTAVGRWWSDTYRHKIGLSHRDLHALRHTVATKLRNADIPEDMVAELLGHEYGRSESFRRYASASTQERLLVALSKLSYENASGAAIKPELHLVKSGT